MDIFPDKIKTLKNLFVIFLIAISALLTYLITDYINKKTQTTLEETYQKENSTLKEQIIVNQIEHTKIVSSIKSDYEKQLKQKVTIEKKADGSSTSTTETVINETKKEVVEVEVIKEVEKIVYVDRIVDVEKETTKTSFTAPTSYPKWSLGVSISPKIGVPYANEFRFEVGFSVFEHLEVFSNIESDLNFKVPEFQIGIRVRF